MIFSQYQISVDCFWNNITMTDLNSLLPVATAAIAGGASLGLTISLAKRLFPLTGMAFDGYSTLKTRKLLTPSAPGRGWGTVRKSEITGLSSSGIIRYRDGFGCGWEITPQHTMLSDDYMLDMSIDRIGRMLATLDKPGSIIQLRISKGPNPGRAVREHQLSIGASTDPGARLPVNLPTAFKRFNARGRSLRTYRDEMDARDEALQIFDLIEQMSPLKMKRLGGEEMWSALYRGHHENCKSVPDFNRTSAVYANALLAGDDLTFTNDRMVIDNQTPVSIITLWLPPHPDVSADLARQLERADLGFRHTIIVEYEALDQHVAKKRINRKIKLAQRNTRKADGRPKYNEEARGIVEQLVAISKAISNNKDRLVATRYTILVYGPPVTDVNDERQLDNARRILNSRCDSIIAAMRSDSGAVPKREDQCTLEYIYPGCVIGEMRADVTGREIIETSQTVAALAPIESPWIGSPRPHTLLSLTRGRLIGLDLWDKSLIMSPTMLIIGGSGSGKSVLLGEIITNVLGTLDDAIVRCVDFDESLGPLVEILGGMHHKFNSLMVSQDH
jgi:hypothetical protein